jgi:hypothetical protein
MCSNIAMYSIPGEKMELKIKRTKLDTIHHIFNNLEEFFVGDISAELAYAALKNSGVIEEDLEIINKQFPYPDQFAEYEEKRMGLVKEAAEKDEAGELVLREGTNEASIPDDKVEEFNAQITALRDEYADALTAAGEVDAGRREFMNGESTLNLVTVGRSDLPKLNSTGKPNGWAVTVMAALSDLIEE